MITEWDVLNACSHVKWQFIRDVAIKIEQTLRLKSGSITAPEVYISVEKLKKQGFVETRRVIDEKHGNRERSQVRITPGGIRARYEEQQKPSVGSFEPGLKPA